MTDIRRDERETLVRSLDDINAEGEFVTPNTVGAVDAGSPLEEL